MSDIKRGQESGVIEAAPGYFSIQGRYIVTANADGSIPLNARIAALLDEAGLVEPTAALIRQANAVPDLLAIFHKLKIVTGTLANDLAMDPRLLWESAPEAYKSTWRELVEFLDLLANVRGRSAISRAEE